MATTEKVSEGRAAGKRRAGKRCAVIVADAVAVLCPYCEAEHPSPHGADTWLPSELRASSGTLVCISCDERFYLNAPTRAQIGGAESRFFDQSGNRRAVAS